MAIGDYNTWSSAEISLFKEKQLEAFLSLKQTLIKYFDKDSPEYWELVARKMQDVLDACDQINYQESETADAYAICHLLDRYHRFQIMQGALIKRNLTIFTKDSPHDILDIGTGPAPALFAFSDFYLALNDVAGEQIYYCKEDYVEQSSGFRNFLHHFCEQLMCSRPNNVPFHHGSFEDFKNISFEQKRKNYWDEWYTQKHRFDIALLSNFLTTSASVTEFRDELIQVCRAIRNHGLIIVVGSCEEKSNKYLGVYKACDEIIARKFHNWKFYGWWRKIIQQEFVYNYSDDYGEEMRAFYSEIKAKFQSTNTWQFLSEKARMNLEAKIANTPDQIMKTGWKGLSWQMTVYQKRVWPTYKAKKLPVYITKT